MNGGLVVRLTELLTFNEIVLVTLKFIDLKFLIKITLNVKYYYFIG